MCNDGQHVRIVNVMSVVMKMMMGALITAVDLPMMIHPCNIILLLKVGAKAE